MIKIINKILIFFGILTIFFISYISLIGLETKRFNNQIKTNLKKIDSNIDIDLKQVKIILNPIEFNIKIKTLGSTIIYKKEKINLESIATSISVFDLLKNNFTSSNFKVSTKPIYIKDLVSLLIKIATKWALCLLNLGSNGLMSMSFRWRERMLLMAKWL